MAEPALKKEVQNIPDRLKIQSQSAYRNVRCMNAFDFVEHTYYGSDGYRDCAYLIPHPREVFYETRRDSSYYVNVFASVINAMVNEVFKDELPRTSGDVRFDKFIKNADGLGATLQEVIEDAMYIARMNDVAFIVMDNYPADVQPATVAEAAQQDIKPYVYIKRMQDVYKYQEDKTGKLVWIDFYDEKQYVDKVGEVDTYRRWTTTGWEHYYTRGKGRSIITAGTHGLGVLPVIPITDFSRKKRLSQIKFPSNYGLAFLCYALFNKESEIVSMEQYQCFSIFYVSGRITTAAIGHANVIEVPLDAKFPPGYTSPNPAMMEGLVKNCDRLTEAIYRNARQKGVIALVEQSGIAKQWDFRGEESVLKRTATAAKGLEMKIAELFGKFIKTTFEYTVEYPKNYSPSFQKDLVSETLEIIKEQPPEPLAKRLWLRVAKQLFGEDKQSGDTLIAEMEDDINGTNTRVPANPPIEGAGGGDNGGAAGEGDEAGAGAGQ
jgi:hypothetical protein